MKGLESFIKDGKVERSRVAMAIASGELTKNEILELCKDSRVKSAFIGTSYSSGYSRDKWNKEYLDELVCAAVAESFNEDYLLYLNEVAESVRSKKNNKSSFSGGKTIGVVAVVVVVIFVIMIVINIGR